MSSKSSIAIDWLVLTFQDLWSHARLDYYATDIYILLDVERDSINNNIRYANSAGKSYLNVLKCHIVLTSHDMMEDVRVTQQNYVQE